MMSGAARLFSSHSLAIRRPDDIRAVPRSVRTRLIAHGWAANQRPRYDLSAEGNLDRLEATFAMFPPR
jgi:hypothetical protein